MKDVIYKRLIKILSDKLGNRPYLCPICKAQSKMEAIRGLWIHTLHENDINPFCISSDGIPTFPIICTNCGYMTQHSVVAIVDDWEAFKKEYESKD